MNKHFKLAIALALIVLTFSCRRMSTRPGSELGNPDGNPAGYSINDVKAPPLFNFNTVETKQIEITVVGQDNTPISNATVMLMDNSFDFGGNVLIKGKTDVAGLFRASIDLPTYYKRLVFNTTFLGIPQNVILNLTSGVNKFTIGGSGLNSYQTVNVAGGFYVGSNKSVDKFSAKLGTWNNTSGLPDYLVMPNNSVSSTMLSQLSSLLPERKSVLGRADILLDDNITKRVLDIVDVAEVEITFAHEGSGNRNVLFYYTYPTGATPNSIGDIDSFYVVMPNTSYNNSGGALGVGNKVNLGYFYPGTTIAFGIAADGWKGGSNGFMGVTTGTNLFFANKELNIESDPNLKQHCVMINDLANNRIITAFEDRKRDEANCDNDFNDLVFYTTVSPSNGVDFNGIMYLPSVFDADGDGANDSDDEFPIDASRAYTNYYPSVNGLASVAYEDLWPTKGDFDMNDMVVDFRYKLTTDAQNQVVDVEADYNLRATGSALQNSFAVEFPSLRSNISTVTGGTLEAGGSNAIIKVFSDSRNEMSQWNTEPGVATSDSVHYHIKFSLTSPVSLTTFGLGEYNPFIWSNGAGKGQGYEIHLPGKSFTNMADVSVFGTEDDNTLVDGSRLYKSKNNLFWALSFHNKFKYPNEKTDIASAYLKFVTWANSGGLLFPDWYLNVSGYRNTDKIYQKP